MKTLHGLLCEPSLYIYIYGIRFIFVLECNHWNHKSAINFRKSSDNICMFLFCTHLHIKSPLFNIFHIKAIWIKWNPTMWMVFSNVNPAEKWLLAAPIFLICCFHLVNPNSFHCPLLCGFRPNAHEKIVCMKLSTKLRAACNHTN